MVENDLPIAATTFERSFRAMKIVNIRLRNQTRDEWMNHCLVTYIDNMPTIQLFQIKYNIIFKSTLFI